MFRSISMEKLFNNKIYKIYIVNKIYVILYNRI